MLACCSIAEESIIAEIKRIYDESIITEEIHKHLFGYGDGEQQKSALWERSSPGRLQFGSSLIMIYDSWEFSSVQSAGSIFCSPLGIPIDDLVSG